MGAGTGSASAHFVSGRVNTFDCAQSSALGSASASSTLLFAFSSPTITGMGFMKRQAVREAKESEANGFLSSSGRHPPAFLLSHRLLDWPKCWLEVHCAVCKSTILHPTKLLAERHGNRSFQEVLGRMRCKKCGAPPETVYLCAGHRTRCGGPPPDWAIELVGPLP